MYFQIKDLLFSIIATVNRELFWKKAMEYRSLTAAAQLAGEGGEVSSALFENLKKKGPEFAKKRTLILEKVTLFMS